MENEIIRFEAFAAVSFVISLSLFMYMTASMVRDTLRFLFSKKQDFKRPARR